jgi:transcriptional regulator with XRE-family HTH domain
VVNSFHESFDWRALLKEQRQLRKLSQPEVARRAQISLSAMKAYEGGDRHPSRETLEAITVALGLPVEEANKVLAGAGYVIDMKNILNERYEPRPLEWFAAEVERYSWPVHVTNQASDVLAANRAFRTLLGIPTDQALPNPKWNWLARASDPLFAPRMENWDDTMSFMIGLIKYEQRWEANVERPAPFMSEPFQQFLAGDPSYISRMLKLWESAEPVPITTRMTSAVRWIAESGAVLSFTSTMHVADLWQELAWLDWIPEDGETWERLRALVGLT